MEEKELKLNFNISFNDLNSNNGLLKIDEIFLNFLSQKDEALKEQLINARNEKPAYTKEVADFLIIISKFLEEFLGNLFNLENELKNNYEFIHELNNLFKCKKNFVQRIVQKKINELDLSKESFLKAEDLLNYKNDIELAKSINFWLEDKTNNESYLKAAEIFVGYNLVNNSNKYNCLYYLPKKVDINNLVPLEGSEIKYSAHIIPRDGFKLQDEGCNTKFAIDQTNYCIFCHNQGKDSCSKGLKEKDGSFKKNEQDVTLTGCPLEEKISEMNSLKTEGLTIAPLAMAMIDNPLLAATGYRICNDCMKACIYQKQEPVDIPQIETRVLKDVLELPFGVEVYILLTKWNPLNLERPLPKQPTNKNVLVVGMGPAGFNLAHHLINDGHNVVGIDGLKIEKLENKFITSPIFSFKNIQEELDKRSPKGFGGVAEYGITVRWDKNFLTLIRIILERRNNFMLLGGIRFGSNITVEQAKDLGFHHVSLAIGAGKPNLPEVENQLVRGVKTASDFLMQLQSGGAFLNNTINNLQIRLPIVVIGGGLTAIDTACEALAYYKKLIEHVVKNYNKLSSEEKKLFEHKLNEEETIIFSEYKNHYDMINGLSYLEQIKTLQKLGGASVVYRKSLQDAPSYRLNHEEVALAMEQGIFFVENANPIEFCTDKFGHVESVKYESDSQIKEILARTVLIAAGTNPNTTLATETNYLKVDGKYFNLLNKNNEKVIAEKIAKPKENYFLTHIEENFSISFIGDAHPSFAGNVVKAMASAKKAYPEITNIISDYKKISNDNFFENIKNNFISYVVSVTELAPKIIEIIINSKLCAENFKPGQFYRLQNFSKLPMEGIALTGAWVNKEHNLVSLIVLEMGGSSDLCRYLKPGEEVILMGPTGSPTHINKNNKVMLIGGGLGNAVLFSIGQELRNNNSEVLYFAGYRKLRDRYKIEEIEKASDLTVWCCDDGKLETSRKQDLSYNNNIIDAIKNYYRDSNKIAFEEIEHIIVIGSDKMMHAVSKIITNELKDLFPKVKSFVASINSPMQCMMKEICAQCLQEHIDPVTNKKYYIYSCVNQDQNVNEVNFEFLSERLKQNSLLEKLTSIIIDKTLKELELR